MLNAAVMLFVSIFALAFSTGGVSQRTVSTYPIASTGSLELATASGDIRVSVWDGKTVEITVEKNAINQADLDRLGVNVDTSDGNLKVKATYPHECTNCQVSFEVKAPRGVQVKARTASGEIRVSEIAGTVDVATASGNIRVTNTGGMVDAESANGDIRVENPGGAVRSKTMSGNIEITGARGDVNARAVSGELSVSFDQLASVGAVALHTTNGNVTLSLPRNAGATITASTVSGSIGGNLGASTRDGYAGASMSRSVGDGRVKITLATVSGDVVLRTF